MIWNPFGALESEREKSGEVVAGRMPGSTSMPVFFYFIISSSVWLPSLGYFFVCCLLYPPHLSLGG